jgi:hypothetical protein
MESKIYNYDDELQDSFDLSSKLRGLQDQKNETKNLSRMNVTNNNAI